MSILPGIFRAAAAAAVLLCASGAAPAQTATPTPTDEELRLQEQKRLLELQRDIEQAKKAIRDAQPQPAAPPTPSATPLAGDTTLENVKLESEMVAYKAMSTAADRISDELRHRMGQTAPNVPRPTLAIYDAQVIKDWRFYQALFPAFEGQVKDIVNRYTTLMCLNEQINAELSDEFKKRFCGGGRVPLIFEADKSVDDKMAAIGPAALQSALGAGTSLLKSFIDLTALFRSDTKITGHAFTVDESALIAELFGALRNKYGQQINLYYPEVFHPRLTRPAGGGPGESDTITTVGTLFLAKIEADNVIDRLGKKRADKNRAIKPTLDRLAALNAELGKVKALNAELSNLRAALAAEHDPAIRGRIAKEIAEVRATRDRLEAQSVLEAAVAAGKAEIKDVQAEIEKIDENVKSLTELNKRFQTFADDFIKVDASGVNALALFVRAEDIQKVMKGDHSYWLEIKSVSAGGNNRVRKNLLRHFTGAKLDHSGGVIIEYALYNKEGGVVTADKLSIYEGYVEPKRIRNSDEFKDVVVPPGYRREPPRPVKKSGSRDADPTQDSRPD
jgi:hypothetical protein